MPNLQCVVLLCLLPLLCRAICWDTAADANDSEGEDPATQLTLFKLEKDDAVCLDGSPGAYYYRPGFGDGINKWYIFHEGGGWCNSYEDCLDRSKNHLGSSVNYTATCAESTGFFNPDPVANPLAYNWNHIYFKYCDGLSFSGLNSSSTVVNGTSIYFRGKAILDAALDDWVQKLGLGDATTDVIISGCSAGGLATYLHCDYYADWMSQHGFPNARMACVPQSGTFLDYDQGAHHYHSYMTWAFYAHNASVNAACLDHYKLDPSKCIFAENAMTFLRTPTFPLQSRFDSWSLGNDFGPSQDVQAINEWGNRVTSVLWNNLLSRDARHGVFLDSCFHHCGYWKLPIENETSATAVHKWYDNDVGAQLFWIQDEPYPCHECCNTLPKSGGGTWRKKQQQTSRLGLVGVACTIIVCMAFHRCRRRLSPRNAKLPETNSDQGTQLFIGRNMLSHTFN